MFWMNELNSNDLLESPTEMFRFWFEKIEESEYFEANAAILSTSTKKGNPSSRTVLVKEYSEKGFVFYTNLDSQKGHELKQNPNVAMCFHWKSLLRQIRVNGTVSLVPNEVADDYYNSRSYESRIGAWASKQSKELKDREQLDNSIKEFKKKYAHKNKVPRPNYWSGWNLSPSSIEFWLDGDNRIHERLRYGLTSTGSKKEILYP